ncbi:hypothetical protein C7M84_023045 [Penaeus vannamei]|uniref:Gustatory receptor n=1 Tax=Penaeus vannamei TaxID=6689 RepID=A0A423U4Y0_PENVA|nr:hypothetical protein C7M84_023045 [Penaeus vannamei]
MDLLAVLVVLLRVLGGFPYLEDNARQAWRARAIDDHERALSKAPKEPRRFRESRPWVWWSRLVYLVILAYMAEYFWELWMGIRKYIYTNTMHAANKVNDTLNLVGLLSLFSYLMWKKSSALELVTEMRKVPRPRRRHSSGKTLEGLLMTLAMVVFTTGHVIILENYVTMMFSKPSVAMASDILETLLFLLIISFTMGFYYAAICLISSAYDDITSNLSELRDSESDAARGSPTPPFLHPQTDPTTKPISASQTTAEDPLAATISYKPERAFDNENLLRDAAARLVRLHRIHRLLHAYLSFPITVALFTSVATTILSFFYISFWAMLDVRTRVLALGYTAVSLLPSLVFFNIPPVLQCQVDEVSRVLQESPGFEVCRVFSLGRARLVDVSAFASRFLSFWSAASWPLTSSSCFSSALQKELSEMKRGRITYLAEASGTSPLLT